jgi:hypothetical protein
MPARKQPTAEDAATARRVLLCGLARDADIFQLVSELAPLRRRDNTFPGEVYLHLAADALSWCRASRADPLPLEGLRERFLPERTFRGRQNTKLQYAVLAAAALHGGTEPDLLEEVTWWQTQCCFTRLTSWPRGSSRQSRTSSTSAPQTAMRHESFLHRLDLRHWSPGQPVRTEAI